MITVATWNVNSIRARLNYVLNWLKEKNVSILSMQETKVEDHLFPKKKFEELGYNVYSYGQKAYNGVATLSKGKAIKVIKGWGNEEEDEKRIITVKLPSLTVVNVYAPRGGKKGTERHAFKLYFFARLKLFLEENFSKEEPLCVVGDMNVARSEIDVYDPKVWNERPGFMKDEREAFEELLSFGLYDLFREKYPSKVQFTWWDIETGAFSRNEGLRIDYILVTKPLLERAVDVEIDEKARKKISGLLPSDHAPVIATFKN